MIQKIATDTANQLIQQTLTKAQYSVAKTPDHAHNGSDSNQIDFKHIANALSVGVAAPTTIPAAVGQIFINTALGKVYMATNTASSAGWAILN